MDKKSFRFKLEDIDSAGKFKGKLSVFGNIDSYGDRVIRGAFKKTIQENASFPFLWQHDSRFPIGNFTAKETKNALEIEGLLTLALTDGGMLKVPEAHRCHANWQAGDIKGLSIGYETLQEETETIKLDDKDIKVNNLKELRLYEGSAVTFPANTAAVLTEIKSIEEIKEQLTRLLYEYKGDANMLGYINSLFDIQEPEEATPDNIIKQIEKPTPMLEGHIKHIQKLLEGER